MKRDDAMAWDYGLAALAGSLAVYSAGMGLMDLPVGLFFVLLVFVGNVFSFAVQRFVGSDKLVWVSGLLYTGVALYAFFNASTLNDLAPDGGLPEDAHLASMAWMLALGSFVAWSESVLVFQAVPCIAIFGMVGTWDTFRGTAFTFFGFLLCMTALLSRVHNRDMLRQARESGFVAISRIRAGPWKWMAGPQWALVSAAAIVIVALVGAPFVQMSVAGVAGKMHVALPAAVIQAKQAQSDSPVAQRGPSYMIGTGPLHPGNLALLAIKLDRPRYLRENAFDQYNGRGWAHGAMFSSPSAFPGDRVWQTGQVFHRTALGQRVLKNPQTIHFSIEILNGIFDTLPVPGEVTQVVVPKRFVDSPSGAMSRGDPGSEAFEGDSLIPGPGVVPETAYKDLPQPFLDMYTDPGPSQKVAEFARQAVVGLKTDYEKALAIKAKIERTAMYNLGAAAVPANQDPVEYFLFTSHEGYCDLFASSMVLMARAVGIPARYATGFYPFSDEQDSEGRTLIRASERHAWAELFFKDAGWVPFDATEGASSVDGYGRGSTGEGVPWFRRPLAAGAIDVLTILATAGTIVFLIVPAIRRAKQGGPAKSTDPLMFRRRFWALYAGLVRDVERLTGVRRDLAQTPREFYDATAARLGPAADPVAAATAAVESGLFSGRELDSSAVAGFAEGVREARKAVRAETKNRWQTAPAFAVGLSKSALGSLRTLARLRREDRKR